MWHRGCVSKRRRLEQRISAEFPAHMVEARRLLETVLANRTLDVEDERLASALCALADGSLARLEHFAQVALQDTRDVLFWGENPPDADESKTYEELRGRLGLPADNDKPG